MYNLEGAAVRTDGKIKVSLSGFLADSCHFARIDDIYPGGNRVYVRDPGFAQVFIVEGITPGADLCTQALVPWSGEVTIPDTLHTKVEVFVNNKRQLEITITKATEETGKFIVTALTSSGNEKHIGCAIRPEGEFFPAIFSVVFGPAPHEECEAWVKENCGLDPGDPVGLVGTTETQARSSELPLARVSAVRAISYKDDLLIHIEGVTSGFGGRFVVSLSPLDVFPPILIIHESPGNSGIIPGNSPSALPTVDVVAFPGMGG